MKLLKQASKLNFSLGDIEPSRSASTGPKIQMETALVQVVLGKTSSRMKNMCYSIVSLWLPRAWTWWTSPSVTPALSPSLQISCWPSPTQTTPSSSNFYWTALWSRKLFLSPRNMEQIFCATYLKWHVLGVTHYTVTALRCWEDGSDIDQRTYITQWQLPTFTLLPQLRFIWVPSQNYPSCCGSILIVMTLNWKIIMWLLLVRNK